MCNWPEQYYLYTMQLIRVCHHLAGNLSAAFASTDCQIFPKMRSPSKLISSHCVMQLSSYKTGHLLCVTSHTERRHFFWKILAIGTCKGCTQIASQALTNSKQLLSTKIILFRPIAHGDDK